MSTINSYMTEHERESYIFDLNCQVELNKISLMIEAVGNKLDSDYLLAEKKVMMENGTYDDLSYLYTEAQEEAKKQKQNIFQKLAELIRQIHESIKKAWDNVFNKDLEGEAPAEFKKTFGTIDKIKDGVSNLVNLAKTKQYAAMTFEGVVGVIKVVNDIRIADQTVKWVMEKFSKEQVKKYKDTIYNKLDKMCNDVEMLINRAANDGNIPAEWAKKIVELMKTVKTKIFSVWTSFTKWLKKKNNSNSEETQADTASLEKKEEKKDSEEEEKDKPEIKIPKSDLKTAKKLISDIKILAKKIGDYASDLKTEQRIDDDVFKEISDLFTNIKDEKSLTSAITDIKSMKSSLQSIKVTEKSDTNKIKDMVNNVDVLVKGYSHLHDEAKKFNLDSEEKNTNESVIYTMDDLVYNESNKLSLDNDIARILNEF